MKNNEENEIKDDKNEEFTTFKMMNLIIKHVITTILFLGIIYFLSYFYHRLGFPMTSTDLLRILPIIITALATFLVFYNVNRTHKNNIENELRKFRRDSRIKLADELIEIITIINQEGYNLIQIMRRFKIQKNIRLDEDSNWNESYNKLMDSFNRIRIVMEQKEHIIFYSEKIHDHKGFSLKYKILNLITSITLELYPIPINKDLHDLNHEENNEFEKSFDIQNITDSLESDLEELNNQRMNIVDHFYDGIFKSKDYSNFTVLERINYIRKGSKIITPFWILISMLFIAYIMEVFIVK